MNPDIFTLQEMLARAFREAVHAMGPEHEVPVSIERPKDKSHGDFSTPVALILGKKLKKPPMVMAQDLLRHLKTDPSLVAKTEVAAPGFINLTLNEGIFHSILEGVLEQNEAYGKNLQAKDQNVLLEFVSANPTGPLNIVNARAAALGDSI